MIGILSTNRRLVIFLGIAAFLLLVVGITVALIIARNNQTAGAPIQTLDVSNPQTAMDKLNEQLRQAVSTVDGADLTNLAADPAAFLSVLGGGDASQFQNAEFGVSYTGVSSGSDVSFSFEGSIQKQAENQYAIEGSYSISASDVPNVGALDITGAVVMLNQELYIKVDSLPSALLQGQTAILSLFTGKWIKIPLDQYSSIAQGTVGVDTDAQAQQLSDLAQVWEQNPPFINARVADARTVDGTTLECMLTELNPVAFNTQRALASEYPPVEVCSAKGGYTPLYFGFISTTKGSEGTLGVTINSLGGELNIVAPTQDVLDLQELIGGGI